MSRSSLEIQAWCVSYLANLLHVPEASIKVDLDFDRHGLDSALAVAMIMELEEFTGMGISPSVLFEHPNIRALAAHLSQRAVEA